MFISLVISAILQVILLNIIPFVLFTIKNKNTKFISNWFNFKVLNDDENKLSIFKVLIISLILGIVITKTLANIGSLNSQYDRYGVKGVMGIPFVLVFSFIQTALSEELLFRGFLLKGLNKRLSFNTANLIQSIIFGTLHILPIYKVSNPIQIIIVFLFPTFIGYILALLNKKCSKDSIIPSYLIHGILNTITGLKMIFF